MRTIDNVVGLGASIIIAVSPAVAYVSGAQTTSSQSQAPIMPKEDFTDKSVNIPSEVLQKFDEQPNYPSRIIRRCSKDDKVFWFLNRIFGTIGDAHYYSSDGKYLGDVKWSDVPFNRRNSPKSPVDLSNYVCTVAKSSIYKFR